MAANSVGVVSTHGRVARCHSLPTHRQRGAAQPATATPLRATSQRRPGPTACLVRLLVGFGLQHWADLGRPAAPLALGSFCLWACRITVPSSLSHGRTRCRRCQKGKNEGSFGPEMSLSPCARALSQFSTGTDWLFIFLRFDQRVARRRHHTRSCARRTQPTPVSSSYGLYVRVDYMRDGFCLLF